MDLTTTFTPQGQSVTKTDAGPMVPAATLPGPGQVDPAFIQMLQQLASQKRQSQMVSGGRALSGRVMSAPQPSPRDFRNQSAQQVQQDAMINPAPQRMTTFASGAINGMTLDPGAMNAYQRAIPAEQQPGD